MRGEVLGDCLVRFPSMNRLKDKVVLITGAARGIGKACAAAFAGQGAKVAVTDLNYSGAALAAAEIGGLARAFKLDVRLEEDWVEVLAQVRANWGALHVLVNNAGITGFEPPLGPQNPEEASLETWRAVHATNLDGVFLGCKYAIAAMKPVAGAGSAVGGAVGGSIVNISSRSGLVGISQAVAYASSKAGVRNHTKSVALYCAEKGYNIRCNSIHPGAILTPMWEPLLGGTPEEREVAIRGFASEVPLGRMGTAQDVANMALFLASDESAYVTGAEFVIDGGILAGSAAAPKS